MDKIIRFLLMLMVLTSFITHTINIDSTNFVIARMTFSDIFGLLAIGVFGLTIIKNPKILKQIHRIYAAGLFLIACMAMSVFTSLAPKSTVTEVLIIAYLFLLSITVFYTFKKNFLQQFLGILIATSFILSFIGLYDVMAININLPTIFNSVQKEHGVSGFRYFGQAANYSFTMLTVLIPLKYSDVSINFSKSKKIFLNVTILLCMLFMISTGRVSIFISFGLGAFIFLICTREKRILKDLGVCLAMTIVFFLSIVKFVPPLFKNIAFRIESRIIHRDQNLEIATIFVDNIKNSILSFSDNNWFGSGLGGFVNHYSEFEIHGTYLKVLGETGLVGTLGYVLFMFYFGYIVYRNRKFLQTNFFYYFIPFFIASLVSWSYNYHLRKKEFWLLLALLMLLDNLNMKIKTTTHNA